MIIKEFRPSITEVAPVIESVVSSGKKVRLAVTGYSMFPLLMDGRDSVTLEKSDIISKYDIVLFKRKSGDFVLHRVIKVKNGKFTIAGDVETKKEYPVYPDEVIAKVCAYERNGVNHTVNDRWFRFYSRFWLMVFPFRRVITRMFFGKLLHDKHDSK